MKNGHGVKMVKIKKKRVDPVGASKGEKWGDATIADPREILGAKPRDEPERETNTNDEKVNGYLLCLTRKLAPRRV
jgi:hypothetical protein